MTALTRRRLLALLPLALLAACEGETGLDVLRQEVLAQEEPTPEPEPTPRPTAEAGKGQVTSGLALGALGFADEIMKLTAFLYSLIQETRLDAGLATFTTEEADAIWERIEAAWNG